MRLIFSILMCFIALFVYSPAYAFIFDKYEVKVKVVDDNGVPVEKANVYIGFDKNTSSGTKMTATKSITATDGEFRASGTGNGYISYGATKEGYYESRYTYSFPGLKDDSSQKREFTILLRKIENPTPMYARRIRKEIPIKNKEVGFDLIKSDWIAPYGEGTTADFSAFLDIDETGSNDFDYKVTITFNGISNGVYRYEENVSVGSVFKLPRYAGLEGYESKIDVFWRGLKRGSKISWDSSRHYILRVRSEAENSKVVKAMYGKIFSDIALRSNRRTGGLPSIEFIYYINPDFTRNLEFDPKNNLFGTLAEDDRVMRP